MKKSMSPRMGAPVPMIFSRLYLDAGQRCGVHIRGNGAHIVQHITTDPSASKKEGPWA